MMTKWYVQDLSKLTGLSVQTLHYYDRIHLLKPSLRLSNGYRLYCEADLLKLQKIIALKFFGFELKQMKGMLDHSISDVGHLETQALALEKQANQLLEASKTLKNIISDVNLNKSIPWTTLIQLIEVYNMTQKLENTWVKEIFTPDELKQYATFEAQWKNDSSKAEVEKSWANLVAEMESNLGTDPKSEIGVQLGEKVMLWLNKVYGKEYAHLRTKKFEQGFGEGKGLDEVGLTPEIVSWMDKAIDSYWRDRLGKILSKVGTGVADDVIFHLWNEALDDMYGQGQNHRKKAIYDLALADDQVSDEAKEWLRTLKELTSLNRHLL